MNLTVHRLLIFGLLYNLAVSTNSTAVEDSQWSCSVLQEKVEKLEASMKKFAMMFTAPEPKETKFGLNKTEATPDLNKGGEVVNKTVEEEEDKDEDLDVILSALSTKLVLLKGDDGRDGLNGIPGIPGHNGHHGEKGDRGTPGTGKDGEPGTKGVKGEPGAQGVVGENGAGGSRGPAGPKGAKGERGYQGQAGSKGSRGYSGSKGARGTWKHENLASCSSGYRLNPYSNTCIRLVTYRKSWSDANNYCRVNGERLATFETIQGAAWLKMQQQTVSGWNVYAWIGGSRSGNTWYWKGLEWGEIKYSYFAEGQPGHNGGSCMGTYPKRNYFWDDHGCGHGEKFFCERRG